jgi:hypothetical protein
MPRKRWRTRAAIGPGIRIEHYDIVRNALVEASAMAHENDDFKKVARLPSEIFEQFVDNLVAAGRIARDRCDARSSVNDGTMTRLLVGGAEKPPESPPKPLSEHLQKKLDAEQEAGRQAVARHQAKIDAAARKKKAGRRRIARGSINAGIRHVSNAALTKHIFMWGVRRAMDATGLLPVETWEHHERIWGHHEGGGESLYYRIAHLLSDLFALNLPRYLEPLAEAATEMEIKYKMSAGMKAWQDAEIARQKLDEWRGWLGHHAFRAQTDAFLLQQRGRSRTPQCLGRMSVVSSLLVEPLWENLQPTPIEL